MVKSMVKCQRDRGKVKNTYEGWCHEKSSKQWLERINAECITPRQFFNRYVRRRMPVVLTSSNTECLRAFSPEALGSIVGNCRVAVERADPDSYQPFGRTDASCRMNMKFSDFIARMEEDELYCSTQPVPEDKQGPKALTSPHVQGLIDRGMLPDHLPLMGNLTPYQINAWIGCSEDGSSSGYHHDFHDNFYMLLAGEKQFRIASPNFTSTRPTYGCKNNPDVLVHTNGLISYQGSMIREDGANVKDVLKWKISKNPRNIEELREQLEELKLEEMMHRMDSKKIDDSFPPSFCIQSTAHGEFITETIKAGEMLYLPASFYHEVISFNSESTTHHMAVNYWYYPPSSSGTFEKPYEDDFWKERWERLAQRFVSTKRLEVARMRRNKLPLSLVHSPARVRKFIKRVQQYKSKLLNLV
jgi:hypothetical protein